MFGGTKSRARYTWVVLFLGFALALAGCSPSNTPPKEGSTSGGSAAQETGPLKIGVIEPISGPVAVDGQQVIQGATIAVEMINAAGGVKGRQLQLVIEDSKNDPAEAVNAANKLITRDNVPVIMGAWGSSPTLAVMPVVKQAKVPLVVETASAPKITEEGNEWVFRIAATSEQEARGVERALGTKMGIKKAAILAVNNDWGRGGAKAYTDAIQRQGGQVVSTDFVDQAATDFFPQLTKIKESGADWVIVNSDVSQIALVVKQHKELGLKQKVLSVGGSNFSDALIELAGPKAAEGVYSVQPSVPWAPEMTPNPGVTKEYLKRFKEKNHPWIGVVEAVRGFDGIFTVAEALKKAKAVDRASIRDALKEVSFDGISTKIKFNEKRQSETAAYLVQIVNGKTELVK